MPFDTFIEILTALGIITSSASGVTKAFKYRLDIFGVTVLGVITALGGGVLRDIMLDKIPVSLTAPHYLYISIITALVLYFSTKRFRRLQKKSVYLHKVLVYSTLIFDAMGLAIFAVIGAQASIAAGLGLLPTAILATITGAGGGIMRDMLVRELPIILKEDVYAILAFGSGIAYYVLTLDFHLYKIPVMMGVLCVTTIIRLLIIKYKVKVPDMSH